MTYSLEDVKTLEVVNLIDTGSHLVHDGMTPIEPTMTTTASTLELTPRLATSHGPRPLVQVRVSVAVLVALLPVALLLATEVGLPL